MGLNLKLGIQPKQVKKELFSFPFVTLKARTQEEDITRVYSTFKLSKEAVKLFYTKEEPTRNIQVAFDESDIFFVKDSGMRVGTSVPTFYNPKLYNLIVKQFDLNENIDNHFKLEVVENEEYNGFPVLKLVEIVSEAFDETEVLNNEVVEESDDFDTL